MNVTNGGDRHLVSMVSMDVYGVYVVESSPPQSSPPRMRIPRHHQDFPLPETKPAILHLKDGWLED